MSALRLVAQFPAVSIRIFKNIEGAYRTFRDVFQSFDIYRQRVAEVINDHADILDGTGRLVRVSTQFDKTTNTTLANITGLTFDVAAAGVYAFRVVLHYSADAVGGHKYAISGNATATSIIYQINSIANATNTFVINARHTALAGSSGQAGSTAGMTIMEGTIVVNAAGTLTVQFAQNASNGTSSILVNSYFQLMPMP